MYCPLGSGWSSSGATSVHVFAPLAASWSTTTLSSLSALQQEALYIPRSALSGLQLIGEGMALIRYGLKHFQPDNAPSQLWIQ